jgi:hypothetical protein
VDSALAPKEEVKYGMTVLLRHVKTNLFLHAGNQPDRPGTSLYLKPLSSEDKLKIEQVTASDRSKAVGLCCLFAFEPRSRPAVD